MIVASASTPSTITKATDEQIGKLFDQIRHGIHNSGITGETFQKMLEQQRELRIRSRVVELLEQIATEIAKSFVIPVNYDEPNAIVQAAEAGKFDYKNTNVEFDDIPLGGTGEAENEVLELHLNRTVYSHDLPAELDSRELEFADPLTALMYAVKLPDRQREYPLGILFNNKQGQLCYLALGEDLDGRGLSVRSEPPGGRWHTGYRFLVVRKKSVQPSVT